MKKVLKYQLYHFTIFLALGIILCIYSNSFNNQNRGYGLTVQQWIIISWVFAGIFQFWVMFFWRLELFYGKISGIFGKSGFTFFRTGFITFTLIRFLPLIPVSFLTRNSIDINNTLKLIIIIGTTILILWGVFSVIFYFGVNRAFGTDHFFEEYRTKSLESRGIFKYIPNSIYTVVLLLVYHPGLFYESSLGLIAALIHHCFVWTHYFCTEKPDMKYIYLESKPQ